MAQIEFSWNTQKNLGLLLIFYGWAAIFQIIPFLHAFSVLKVGTGANDWMIFVSIFIFMVVTVGSLLATTFENLFNPQEKPLIDSHTLILIALIVFMVGYFFGTPIIREIEPFLGLSETLIIEGWLEFFLSELIGLSLISAIWYTSEQLK